MNFRSDKQRKAMFANMVGKNSFSNDNKFTLYTDSRVNRLRSDIYPSVDVDIDVNDRVMLDLLGHVSRYDESKDERNLAGLGSIKRRQVTNVSGEPVYNIGATYDVETQDITLSPKIYNKETGTIDDILEPGLYRNLLHEVRHHIDDELTLDSLAKLAKDDNFVKGDNKFEDFANFDIDFLERIQGQPNMEHVDVALDRVRFADELKNQTTPTFKELEEYAK